MKTLITCWCALSALSPALSTAQERPNFAGHWTLVSVNPAVTTRPPDLMVKQDAATFTYQEQVVYKLDGVEQRATRGPAEVVWKATWEGDTLILNHTSIVGGATFSITQAWSLDLSGRLVIKSTINQTPPTTTTLVYER